MTRSLPIALAALAALAACDQGMNTMQPAPMTSDAELQQGADVASNPTGVLEDEDDDAI
ncbi:hypothetical protein SAMN04490244_104359 [Tranquillimonas rosea]|uniref:Lipoprotein-attachment site-containing protein n=1 Tax=Tranquillimonas rosea TaxID=641238 RepID=A0A1H9TTF2_9RHOB|nr:hypothetical protein [Tranquillimonas rosea]SES00277.1 hypothetical protein SAMN04490244_104359 [Tranquillimonas rosea]